MLHNNNEEKQNKKLNYVVIFLLGEVLQSNNRHINKIIVNFLNIFNLCCRRKSVDNVLQHKSTSHRYSSSSEAKKYPQHRASCEILCSEVVDSSRSTSRQAVSSAHAQSASHNNPRQDK